MTVPQLPPALVINRFSYDILIGVIPVFALEFTGSPRVSYQVWATDNLTAWTLLGSTTETTPGQYQYLDLQVLNQIRRFYRISAP